MAIVANIPDTQTALQSRPDPRSVAEYDSEYRKYHRTSSWTVEITSAEFIRRFLLHVLPDGFQRIRYYGFLGNRYREEKLSRCRQLLGMPADPPHTEESKDYRERYEELTGCSLRECPFCHQGRMVTVATLLPSPDRQTLIMDTS